MTIIKKASAIFLALLMVASLAVPVLAWDVVGSKVVVTFDPGDGTGPNKSNSYTLDEDGKAKISLPSSGYTANKEGYVLDSWSIGGKTVSAGGTYTYEKKGSPNSDGEYTLTATAKYRDKNSSSSSSSTSESADTIVGTFKSGFDDKSFTKKYTKNKAFALPECSFERKGYDFVGWSIDGTVIDAGVKVKSDSDFTATAKWEKSNIVLGDDTSSSGSSASSTTSSTPPSTSSSSVPSTSSSSVTSKSSSSVPSKSSSSVPASTSSETSSEQEPIADPEPVVEEFKPITIAYSISGDIPVNSVEFVLNEDIGATPELGAIPLDSYSNTDPVTASLIASGDALAAFDLALSTGSTIYEDNFDGTVTYGLNGTQASATSNYKEFICAMAHVIDVDKFTGSSYYMLDGKQTCIYDIATGNKSEVDNITLVEKDGVCRAVIGDVDSLSKFAYLASPEKIVEVVLMPDKNAESVSMDVTSLSPVMLIQMEMGKGGKAAGGMPGWVWIIIAVLVVLIVATVVFLVLKNRKPSYKAYTDESVTERVESTEVGASVTGFDDDDN